jgi:hypothetical protein
MGEWELLVINVHDAGTEAELTGKKVAISPMHTIKQKTIKPITR